MVVRGLFVLLLAYVVFDLADPVLPGAFSFDVEDSEIDEATTPVGRRDAAPEDGSPGPAPAPATDACLGDIGLAHAETRPGRHPACGPVFAWRPARSALLALSSPLSSEDH